jgi:hypothetical protein
MNRDKLLQTLVGVVLVMALLAGCGAASASTPEPTVTPYPTYTPYPTFTPVPHIVDSAPVSPAAVGETVVGPRWKVKVVKVETASEYEGFSFKAGTNRRFVIVTLEYTYLGSEEVELYPESVLLVHTGTGLKGYVRTPALYKAGYARDVTNFSNSFVTSYLKPKSSETDTFIYEFDPEYTDFLLYFPETVPIEINLG